MIANRALLLIVVLVALVGCESEPSGKPVFQQAKWGHSQKQVLKLYEGKAKLVEGVVVIRHVVGGFDAQTSFYFAPGKGLAMIISHFPFDDAKKVVKDLTSSLTQKLEEKPVLVRDDTASWVIGETSVNLYVQGWGPIPRAMLGYSRKGVSIPIKAPTETL